MNKNKNRVRENMICRFQQAVSFLMTFEYLLRFPDIMRFWTGLEDVFISLNPVELLITVCFSSCSYLVLCRFCIGVVKTIYLTPSLLTDL